MKIYKGEAAKLLGFNLLCHLLYTAGLNIVGITPQTKSGFF